jgi:hypothetical protein
VELTTSSHKIKNRATVTYQAFTRINHQAFTKIITMQYQQHVDRINNRQQAPLPVTTGPSKKFHLSSRVKKNEPTQVLRLNDNGDLSNPSAPSAIEANIQKFGGGVQSIPLVQRRTNQLQKKWEKDNKPRACTTTPSSKVEWYTSPNTRRLKKRVVLA